MKKKVKTCILSILLSLSCLCGSICVVNASTSPHRFNTSYNGAQITATQTAYVTQHGSTYDAFNIITIELGPYYEYTGNVSLNWTASSNYLHDISQWDIMVVGGRLTTTNYTSTQNKLTINFYHQTSITVYLHYVIGAIYSDPSYFDFTSISSTSCSFTETYAEQNIADIDLKVINMDSTLSDMLTDMDYLPLAYSTLQSINTYLDSIDDSNTDIFLQTQLIQNKVNNIMNNVTSILNAINNMDESLDLITFNNLVAIAGFTTDFTSFLSSAGSYSSGYYCSNPIIFNYSSGWSTDNAIIKFQIPINRTTISEEGLYMRNETTGSLIAINNCIVYKTENRSMKTYYIFLNNTQSNFYNNTDGYRFVYQYTVPNTTYINFTTSRNITYIKDTDIEYYSLLNTFNQFNMINNQTNLYSLVTTLNSSVLAGNIIEQNIYSRLQDVIDAINHISITVDQDTQIVINNYNDVYTDIHDIEINFMNQFNSSNQSVDLDNTDISNNLIEPTNYISLRLDKILTIPYVQPLLYLLLVAVVTVCILG